MFWNQWLWLHNLVNILKPTEIYTFQSGFHGM